MSRRLCSRSDQSDANDKYRNNTKRRDRSRSPPAYGFTSDSTKRSCAYRRRPPTPPKTNGFIPDENTRKFYDKSSNNEDGFWTSEDYTFRDMLAKDVRAEIEDDIESKNSDEESDEDPELAEYADRADMNNDDEKQRKTMVERMITTKKEDDEKKKAIKLKQS